MMTSPRLGGQVGGSFANRRGHASQLSISDPSHHVTEAIGTLYGDEDESPLADNMNRPLSFIGGSPFSEQIHFVPQNRDLLSPDASRQTNRAASEPTSPLFNGERGSLKKSPPAMLQGQQRKGSFENGPKSPRSPPLSLRDVQTDAATSQYTLTNIDNANDIAQELSNLQALRRMSMDVGNIKDPDMPQMSLSSIPLVAPTGDDDEADPSRLLWVPARVHPELAPTEFKSFLETRVQSIRRKSRDMGLGDGDLGPSNSGSSLGVGQSLRRQKSKLSRQIVNNTGQGASGYVDGAERLERQRSQRERQNSELSLEDLVKDPTKAVKRLAQESQAASDGAEGNPDDRPILPMPPGMGLRRSTRTQYRKGGSLRGERPFSRRVGHRHQESEDSGIPPVPAPPGHAIMRVQTEPISEEQSRSSARSPELTRESAESSNALDSPSPRAERPPTQASSQESHEPAKYASASEYSPRASEATVEQDKEIGSPPREGSVRSPIPAQAEPAHDPIPSELPPKSSRRKLSQNASPSQQYTKPAPNASQNLNEQIAGNSNSYGGNSSSRTDSLAFIPTFNSQDEKKKSKKDKDDDSASTKSTSSAWKWFKSSSEDKEKKKEEGKKSRTKALVERAQDNVRLDVIQTSIDKTAIKGRESVVLDRDSVDSKLQDDRRKDGHRKSDGKKEKDSSIFSSIFGGSKKKEEKDRHSKKSQHLRVPSEPPVVKPLEPDVDYHWTRFPLLEERAIYRMAHIKLANPRRPLLSQVLLSNFMYSYLAIVQAMHPNMNVPVSPQQKRLEEEARRKREEEEYLAQQQMQTGQNEQDLDQYDFDYHRSAVAYGEAGASEEVDYVDDAQIYEDEHGTDHHHQQTRQQDYGYEGTDSYGHEVKDYYQYHDNDQRRDGRDNNMW